MSVTVSEEVADWIGRRVRIIRGSETHEGTLKGLSDVIVATSAKTASRAWELETESGTIGFGPDWVVTPLN